MTEKIINTIVFEYQKAMEAIVAKFTRRRNTGERFPRTDEISCTKARVSNELLTGKGIARYFAPCAGNRGTAKENAYSCRRKSDTRGYQTGGEEIKRARRFKHQFDMMKQRRERLQPLPPLFFDVLNQIPRLAVQQGAERFKVIP